MPKQSPQALAIASALTAATEKQLIDEGHRWQQLAEAFKRGDVLAQSMFGMVLAELKRKLGFVQGGARDQKPHAAVFASWGEFLKKTYDLSDDTARRYMDMGEGVRGRLNKVGGDLKAILSKPLATLTPAEYDTLKKATHKITDGRTQAQLLLDFGIAKQPTNKGKGTQESAAKGQATKDAKKDGPLVDSQEQAAIDVWTPILRDLLREVETPMWPHLPATGDVSLETLHGALIDLGKAVAAAKKGGRS